MVKERPILFSGAMVRGILADVKWHTRRVAKGVVAVHAATGEALAGIDSVGPRVECPYGKPGDRLWVRETFFAFGRWETRFSQKKGRDEWHFIDLTLEMDRIYQYSDPTPSNARQRSSTTAAWWKRPAIYMPREASRISLDVTGVRIERLQDISEADAAAEGLYHDDSIYFNGPWFLGPTEAQGYASPIDAYRALWEQINGAGSWDVNPMVWVVEFRRV